jgi:hypothetical protein
MAELVSEKDEPRQRGGVSFSVLVERRGRAHIFEHGAWRRADELAITPTTQAQAERAFPEAFGEEPEPARKR